MKIKGESKIVKGYKGFDKNLKCRDFQFEVGKKYKIKTAKLCESGFHFCEYPKSAATNTGSKSAASVEGKNSIAFVSGYDSKAKGLIGCGICIAERDSNFNLITIKAAIVDGNTIKSDTYYKLINGELIETK